MYGELSPCSVADPLQLVGTFDDEIKRSQPVALHFILDFVEITSQFFKAQREFCPLFERNIFSRCFIEQLN